MLTECFFFFPSAMGVGGGGEGLEGGREGGREKQVEVRYLSLLFVLLFSLCLSCVYEKRECNQPK